MTIDQPDRPVDSVARARWVLGLTIALTAVLYAVPVLRPLAWPLRLLSTLAHELGHGLAAVLVGGRFEALLMWSDGAGVATWSALVGRLGHAFIAAGGLVGPAIGAALLFACGRTERGARISLALVGVGLVVADVMVVRTLFGAVFVAALAVVALALAVSGAGWVTQAVLVFAAVQLALSVFSRADYLFTPVAHTPAGVMPSDVAQIADALILPYWVWGSLCGLVSVGVLLAGLVLFVRRGGARVGAGHPLDGPPIPS